MRKNIRVSEPSAEMQMKIQRARHAISSQKMRMVKCPYQQTLEYVLGYADELAIAG